MADGRSSEHGQQMVLCPVVIDGIFRLTMSFLFTGFFPNQCRVTQNDDYVVFEFSEVFTSVIIRMNVLPGYRLMLDPNDEHYDSNLGGLIFEVRERRDGWDGYYSWTGLIERLATAPRDFDLDGGDDKWDGYERYRDARRRRHDTGSTDDDDYDDEPHGDHTYTRFR